MRYLRAPSLFHLRLGWLDVLVRLVGAGARPLTGLHEELLRRAEQFPAWRTHAGLTETPHGALMPSHVGALARMVASFGLYDDRSERLNDAGHVLLATPEEARSPFLWEGARRWVGLWLLMRADGDVTAAILRSWSTLSLRSRDADDLVIEALKRLAARVGDIEGDDLLGQARRATETSNGRRTIVSSRLEPLRELGYCARLPSTAGYLLTERGARLRDALLVSEFAERGADELLREGLSRCYLLGEGVESAPAASFDALVEGFRLCPEGLRVADEEAPLSPLIAWIQWSLLQQGPPLWLDDTRAVELVRTVRDDPRGSFELKRGEHVHDLNLVWRTALRTSVAPSTAGSQPSVPLTIPPAEPSPVVSSPTPSGHFVWDHRAEMSALLWLQYVKTRIEALDPGDADALRRGGVATRLRQLDALLRLPLKHLENKRRPAPDGHAGLPLPAISCLSRRTQTIGHERALDALVEEWGAHDRADTDALRARITSAQKEVGRSQGRAHAMIRAFVETEVKVPITPQEVIRVFNGDWPKVQEHTRSLLSDLLGTGAWTAEALDEHLQACVTRNLSPREAAVSLLGTWLAPPRRYEYWERRRASSEWLDAARASGEFTVADAPDGVSLTETDDHVRLGLRGIEASSAGHARRIGAQRCDDAVAQASTSLPAGQLPERIEGGKAACDSDEDPVLCDEPMDLLDESDLVEAPARAAPPRAEHLQDARRSLARVRALERRDGERLLTTWTILEDLAKGGRDLPSYEVIARVARACAVGMFRRRLLKTYDRAIGALLALAHFDSAHSDLPARVAFWSPSWGGLARLRDQSEPARRKTLLARAERWRRDSDEETLRRLWTGCARNGSKPCCEAEALQWIITQHAPLAARRLADVWTILDVAADGTLQEPRGVVRCVEALLDDARAFLSDVYDARNRIVHQGELGRLHERDAPVRLDALTTTTLRVVEFVVDELQKTGEPDLHGAWATLSLRARDLSSPNRIRAMNGEEFAALLGI